VVMRFLVMNANWTGAILRTLGEEAHVQGRVVASPRFSLEVSHGCDAVQPTALFVSAMIATPVLLRRKLFGAVVGITILLTLNLLRIVSLYYIGVFIPKHFDFMHVEVWGAVFILLSISLWLVWASWATRAHAPRPKHAPTD